VTPEGAKAFAEATTHGLNELYAAQESGDQARITKAQHDYASQQMRWAAAAVQNVLRGTLPEAFNGFQQQQVTQRQAMITDYDTAVTKLEQNPTFANIRELLKDGAIDKVFEDNPALKQSLNGRDGKPLPRAQNYEAQLRMAVLLHRGQAYKNPTKLVQTGIETGKKQANDAANAKALGRLGSGQSKGTFPGKDSAGDFMAELLNADKAANPMRSLSDRG
jgi:hypothetical protein